jgi:glucosamine kinase
MSENRSPDWILGLDGGGTKTVLALANRAGEVRAVIAGAGINPFDQPAWRAELERLLNQSPVRPNDLAYCCFGMPGYGESETISVAQLEAARGWAGTHCSVLNDVAVAFTGALGGDLGVLVLAGTGSMAWGAKDSSGLTAVRVGGWGEGFGDEGSAHWIGLQSLQKLSWVLDGRLEDSGFRDGILHAIGIVETGLMDWFYNLEHGRSEIAALAKATDRLAASGNLTAQKILLEAAQQLVSLARAAQQKLRLEHPNFSYAGGVFRSRTILETVQHELKPYGNWLEPRGSPLMGALFEAARGAGWEVNAAWFQSVNSKLESGRERL